MSEWPFQRSFRCAERRPSDAPCLACHYLWQSGERRRHPAVVEYETVAADVEAATAPLGREWRYPACGEVRVPKHWKERSGEIQERLRRWRHEVAFLVGVSVRGTRLILAAMAPQQRLLVYQPLERLWSRPRPGPPLLSTTPLFGAAAVWEALWQLTRAEWLVVGWQYRRPSLGDEPLRPLGQQVLDVLGGWLHEYWVHVLMQRICRTWDLLGTQPLVGVLYRDGRQRRWRWAPVPADPYAWKPFHLHALLNTPAAWEEYVNGFHAALTVDGASLRPAWFQGSSIGPDAPSATVAVREYAGWLFPERYPRHHVGAWASYETAYISPDLLYRFVDEIASHYRQELVGQCPQLSRPTEEDDCLEAGRALTGAVQDLSPVRFPRAAPTTPNAVRMWHAVDRSRLLERWESVAIRALTGQLPCCRRADCPTPLGGRRRSVK